jgi:hypothetical protein
MQLMTTTTYPLLHKTPVAARMIGATLPQLRAAITNGKLAPPERRDESGHFLWDTEDLERARAALAVDRRRRPQPA